MHSCWLLHVLLLTVQRCGSHESGQFAESLLLLLRVELLAVVDLLLQALRVVCVELHSFLKGGDGLVEIIQELVSESKIVEALDRRFQFDRLGRAFPHLFEILLKLVANCKVVVGRRLQLAHFLLLFISESALLHLASHRQGLVTVLFLVEAALEEQIDTAILRDGLAVVLRLEEGVTLLLQVFGHLKVLELRILCITAEGHAKPAGFDVKFLLESCLVKLVLGDESVLLKRFNSFNQRVHGGLGRVMIGVKALLFLAVYRLGLLNPIVGQCR